MTPYGRQDVSYHRKSMFNLRCFNWLVRLSDLYEQYVKSLGLTPSEFDFLFRTRPRALDNNHPLPWTLRPKKKAAISQMTFSKAFSWMKMFKFRLKFHWSSFLRVQMTIFQHWFRWRQWRLNYRHLYASIGLIKLIIVYIYIHIFVFFFVKMVLGPLMPDTKWMVNVEKIASLYGAYWSWESWLTADW